MAELTKLTRDLSIFKKFNFEKPPVGVKFLYGKPEGIPRLDKKLALCEMVTEAQKGKVFYADLENHECAGPIPLGMVDMEPFFEAGQLGPRLDIFKEARANRRIYQYIPKLVHGSCNYTVFASLDKLTFEPDVLIVSGTARQAEIILRSMSYTTGQMYESKGTPVLGCAWTFVYPYLTGKINFSVTGLTFGHIAREVGKEGSVVVSIPYDALPTMIENLKDMKWELPSYTEGRDKYNERFKRETSNILQTQGKG
jgi:uncharacterized protein (DUF169 family)